MPDTFLTSLNQVKMNPSIADWPLPNFIKQIRISKNASKQTQKLYKWFTKITSHVVPPLFEVFS